MVKEVTGYICERCITFYYDEEHARECEKQCEETEAYERLHDHKDFIHPEDFEW